MISEKLQGIIDHFQMDRSPDEDCYRLQVVFSIKINSALLIKEPKDALLGVKKRFIIDFKNMINELDEAIKEL